MDSFLYTISSLLNGLYLIKLRSISTKHVISLHCNYTFINKSIPWPIAISIAWLYTHLIVNACAVPAALLQWHRGVKLSNDLYWSA